MPKHNFGIMPDAPKAYERYDSYIPEKYNCISVDDNYIFPLLERLREVKCYWHSLDNPELGLAYWGVTLIPPESLSSIIEIIWHDHNLSDLMYLLNKAENENKYIIHYGI